MPACHVEFTVENGARAGPSSRARDSRSHRRDANRSPTNRTTYVRVMSSKPMTPMHTVRILVADDQADIVTALKLLLGDEGFDVVAASSPDDVIERAETSEFDLALIDLNYTRDTTSGAEGLELMDRLKTIDPSLPVIVMTAWSSVGGAVEAMRRGARDYIEKPWADERLVTTLKTHVDLRRALTRGQRLEEAGAPGQRRSPPPVPRQLAALEKHSPGIHPP